MLFGLTSDTTGPIGVVLVQLAFASGTPVASYASLPAPAGSIEE